MIFLIFSILSSLLISITFRIIDRFGIKLFPIIIINYITAFALGAFAQPEILSVSRIFSEDWIFVVPIIGTLLIVMFFTIGISTQRAGLGVTVIASKMSVIIPIVFSIIYFHESMGFLKTIGILTALVAVFLSVYKKQNGATGKQQIFLPLLLFLGAGILDAFVKFTQEVLLPADDVSGFTGLCFGAAGIIGIVVAFFNKISFRDYFSGKTILTGVILGAANYGSMYFLILALNSKVFDSSIVYGINNVGIILLALLPSVLIFKESFSNLNKIGSLLAVIAVVVLMFA